MPRIGDIAKVRPGMGLAGRGAGRRVGPWDVRLVNGANIIDDRLDVDALETIQIEQTEKTQPHLLRPYDVIVTAKSSSVKLALVPPTLSLAVANATLLVVRAVGADAGPYIWWFLTSTPGRRAIEARLVASTTLFNLPANALAEVELPMPPARELYRIAQLVEQSERAYGAAREAAELRRTAIRDGIIGSLVASSEGGA